MTMRYHRTASESAVVKGPKGGIACKNKLPCPAGLASATNPMVIRRA